MLYVKSSKLAIILSISLWFTFSVNLLGNNRANSGSYVLVTEVLFDTPNGDATEEWVELFNPSSLSISIEGGSISDNVDSFSLTGAIPSDSYITIARDSTAFNNLYGLTANNTGSTLELGNSGDFIVDNSNYVPQSIPPIKFMTYNIEQSGANPDWISVVKEENPDIIIFVETGKWDDSNDALLNQYASELNAYFVDETPYVGTTGQNIGSSTSGEAIMSRFPILSTTQLADVQLDDGSFYDVSHDFMIWEVDVGSEIVYVIGTHLKCCGGDSNEEKRERAQEGIINYMDSLGDVPIIYAGDLNSFSPFDTGNLAPKGDLASGPLTMMLKPQDPTYGQFSSEIHTFVDVYRELNPNTPGYTYGYQNLKYESRIDFIIANQYFFDDLINSTVGDEGPAKTGSDHYTVDVFIEFDNNVVSKETTSNSTSDSTSNSTSKTTSKTTTTSTNPVTSSIESSDKKETLGPRYLTTIIAVFTLSILNSARSRKYLIK